VPAVAARKLQGCTYGRRCMRRRIHDRRSTAPRLISLSLDETLRALPIPRAAPCCGSCGTPSGPPPTSPAPSASPAPAASQHLKLLREAGLVQVCADGNRRLYRVDLERLSEVRSQLEDFWGERWAGWPPRSPGGAAGAPAAGWRMTAGGPDAEVVTCEVVVPAAPDEVFRWFVEPDLLVRWIGVHAELEPRPGGRLRFETTAGQWCTGRYLEVGRRRQAGGVHLGMGQRIPVPPGSSTVEFDLLAHAQGTRVRLRHRDLVPEVRPLHADGWSRFLPRLVAVVAGRNLSPRPADRGLPPT
jgi:uncharacterized protein YndB with AHSA1/START domain/DNA-binding transcriptional ArsR family regulator